MNERLPKTSYKFHLTLLFLFKSSYALVKAGLFANKVISIKLLSECQWILSYPFILIGDDPGWKSAFISGLVLQPPPPPPPSALLFYSVYFSFGNPPPFLEGEARSDFALS